MEIEKTNRMNALFEFYSTLLTEKQMNYMELYYADDFSLGEIAEEYQMPFFFYFFILQFLGAVE